MIFTKGRNYEKKKGDMGLLPGLALGHIPIGVSLLSRHLWENLPYHNQKKINYRVWNKSCDLILARLRGFGNSKQFLSLCPKKMPSYEIVPFNISEQKGGRCVRTDYISQIHIKSKANLRHGNPGSRVNALPCNTLDLWWALSHSSSSCWIAEPWQNSS